jgi:hypothetical protein
MHELFAVSKDRMYRWRTGRKVPTLKKQLEMLQMEKRLGLR